MQQTWKSALRHRRMNTMRSNWKSLQAMALAEVEATLAALPAPLRERALQLPITFERVPNAGLQADGIDADTLGLFVGPEFAEETNVPMPPRNHSLPGKHQRLRGKPSGHLSR